MRRVARLDHLDPIRQQRDLHMNLVGVFEDGVVERIPTSQGETFLQATMHGRNVIMQQGDQFRVVAAGDCAHAALVQYHGGEMIYCEYYHLNTETRRTYIPLVETREVNYGQRERHFLSEIGFIEWENEQPKSFVFVQRRALLGTSEILNKIVSGNMIAGHDQAEVGTNGNVVNLQVNELLAQGQGALVEFRLPPGNLSPDASGNRHVRDESEERLIGGVPRSVEIVYLRDPNRRIEIMREYVRLLILMERRLSWHITIRELRKTRDIERVLNSASDY